MNALTASTKSRMIGGQRVAPRLQTSCLRRSGAPSCLRSSTRTAARAAAAPLGASRALFNGARIQGSRSSRSSKIASRGIRLVLLAAKRSVGDLSEADLKGKKVRFSRTNRSHVAIHHADFSSVVVVVPSPPTPRMHFAQVFVRADLNVPLDGDCNITDDTRIRAAVPTLKYLLDKGAKVLLTSHLGRPKDGPEDKFRLNPVVPRLSEYLGKEVAKADDCIGSDVEAKVASMKDGDILVLENVRFYKEETKNEAGFAEKLAANADMFVNDAFGTAHRAHASTEGVTKFLTPSVSGFLLQKELDYLDGAVSEPKRPFCAIVGGSKVSSKIGVIESLMEKCDKIIIGGGMIFTFYVAR